MAFTYGSGGPGTNQTQGGILKGGLKGIGQGIGQAFNAGATGIGNVVTGAINGSGIASIPTPEQSAQKNIVQPASIPQPTGTQGIGPFSKASTYAGALSGAPLSNSPVKSVVHPDGTKITYDNGGGNSDTQNKGTTPNDPSTYSDAAKNAPTVGNATNLQGNNGTPFDTNVKTLTNIGENITNDPQYQAIQNEIQQYSNAANLSPLTGQAGAGEQGAEAGVAGVNQQKNNALLQSAQNKMTQFLQAKGLSIEAANSAAGLTAPQAYSPTNVPYYPGQGYGSPAANQYGSGGIASVGGINAKVQQGSDVQTMKGTQAQAQSLGKNLTSLINSAGINPANASVLTSFANGVNQWINSQSGDPKYQNFANLINEISSRYAGILNQAGGTPTDQSTISHSIINGLASGNSIEQVLGSLDKNATDSINSLNNVAEGGSTGSSTPTFGSFN